MRAAEVLVASCAGSDLLSERVGLPLVHIDAVDDAEAALDVLNASAHGSGYRIPRMFQPVITETGWSSWARSPLRRGGRELTAPPGLRLHAGRLSVDLSDGVGLPDLRSELRGALRHLRVQDVAIRMPYMAARSDACVDYIVQPRYTLARGGFRTARLVEDLYVLDCGEQLWRLLWLVSAACLAAKDRRGSDWL